jgi:transcriptional regulator with XRE-family HTH domain
MAKKKAPRAGTRSTPTDRRSVFAALKRILRARGVTYAALGARLDMSESGVKKIFASEDCTLSRLEAIAAAAAVPLAELFEAASSTPFEQVALTEAQQKALLDKPALLHVFWKLSVERWPPRRIARAFGLDDRAMFKVLAELDRLALIVLEQPGDRVRLRHGDLVRWLPEGPLLDHLHEQWGRDVLRRAAHGGVQRLSQLWLRPGARAELEAELTALVDGYVRRGRAEWLVGGEAAVTPHGLSIALAEGSFVRPPKSASRR